MFIVAKKVHNFNYYWNENKSQWEGLMDNATLIKDSQMDFWHRKITSGKDFREAYIITIK